MKDTSIILTGSNELAFIKEPPTYADSSIQRMKEILEAINDTQKPVSDISRMIAGELASVTTQMAELNQTDGYKIKFLSERIKALREVSKTLADSETLSKRDILNFDGPKFLYAFQEILACFKKAMKETGLPETSANEVLRNFRDIMAMKEIDLRRQTDKVESTFVTK